jgi:hypothetical protein
MNENSSSKVLHNSFEEFRRTFCPETTKAQESQKTEEPYARDLAKYAVESHSPPREGHE